MLLQTRDEDGSPMSDRQVRDEVVTLIFTGSETVALALSYVWYLLALHPEVQARLADELGEALGGRPPALEDLHKLTYTEKIIKEALRLYPPVWAFVRQAVRPVELGGYTLPAGTTVVMSQWVAHRDRRFFNQPSEFRPERWTAEFEGQLPKFAYFPFGGGQRTCIGASFAKMEITLLLATMAQRFRASLAAEFKLELLPSITLQPKRGVSVILHERAGAVALVNVPAPRCPYEKCDPASATKPRTEGPAALRTSPAHVQVRPNRESTRPAGADSGLR